MDCRLKLTINIILAFVMVFYLYKYFGEQTDVEYRVSLNKKNINDL